MSDDTKGPITYPSIKYKLNIYTESEELERLYTNGATAHVGDSGIDLYTSHDILIEKTGTVNFHIKCSMVNIEKNEYTSYFLYPRSSISNTPLQMANSVGIIDAGYRGEIMCKLRNTQDVPFLLSKGTRLCQICAPDLAPISVSLTDVLDVTSRGAGGFGSTGK